MLLEETKSYECEAMNVLNALSALFVQNSKKKKTSECQPHVCKLSEILCVVWCEICQIRKLKCWHFHRMVKNLFLSVLISQLHYSRERAG